MREAGSALLLALALTACSLGGPDQDATGEEIYAQLCAGCHGADLGGGVGPTLGPNSNIAAESDEFIEFTVSNGRGRMPSFPSLDDRQIARLVAYIREEQGR
ncbi:MAG TPA: cytochrome c [Acidimicrobiia bacterium]